MPSWSHLTEIADELLSDENLQEFRNNHSLVARWADEWANRYPGQYVLVGGGVLILVTGDTSKLHDFIDRYKNVVVRKLPAAGDAPPI